MPLLYVNLIVWHVVSRLLVLYIFITNFHPLNLSAAGREVGDFLILIGVGFFALAILICAPTAMATGSSPLARSTAFVGMIFGFLVCLHDVLSGSEIRNGGDFLFLNLIHPVQQIVPTQTNILVWILLIASIFLVTIGSAWLVVAQTRRTSRRSQARSRPELIDFPDSNP